MHSAEQIIRGPQHDAVQAYPTERVVNIVPKSQADHERALQSVQSKTEVGKDIARTTVALAIILILFFATLWLAFHGETVEKSWARAALGTFLGLALPYALKGK